jgi:hypothetical protein
VIADPFGVGGLMFAAAETASPRSRQDRAAVEGGGVSFTFCAAEGAELKHRQRNSRQQRTGLQQQGMGQMAADMALK